MQANVKSFWIRTGVEGHDDEAALAAFLRGVDVVRLETAYDQGWHVLVLYSEARVREEAKQISAAIRASIDTWQRRQKTDGLGATSTVLSDTEILQIANSAPTTVRELRDLLGGNHQALQHHAESLTNLVRQTLAELSPGSVDTLTAAEDRQ